MEEEGWVRGAIQKVEDKGDSLVRLQDEDGYVRVTDYNDMRRSDETRVTRI